MHREPAHGHRHHDHHHHGHDGPDGHAGHDHDHNHDHGHHHEPVGPGHNRARPPRAAAQWQVPHRDAPDGQQPAAGEPDLDQVEAAFIEGFLAASDPTSFLRLAGIPFKMQAADGATLSLLRVETEVVADVGSVTPHLGGGSFRYDPLPAPLVARRRRLRFVYFDGSGLRALDFASARLGLAQAAQV